MTRSQGCQYGRHRPEPGSTAPDAATLDRLGADVAAGRLRVPVTRTYRLAEVPQGMADFAGGTLGKLAVTID